MEQKDAQWEEELRRGILGNLSHYRRRLQDQQGQLAPLDPQECDALADMLNVLEDYVRVSWDISMRVEVTRRAGDRIRPLEGL